MRSSALAGTPAWWLRTSRLWLVGLAILAGAAVAGRLLLGTGAATTPFETAALTRGPLTARVTATGTLSPRVQVQVGSQVSGRVQELLADFNDRVTKGQVVARIDPRLFEADVARAQANLQVARAALQRAQAEFEVARQTHERTRTLAKRELVSDAQADADRASYRASEAQVASARAALGQSESALEQARIQLAYTTIVSPIDGVVISREVNVGQTVAASFQAPQLFTIAEDLRKMEVHTSVAEADVGRLEPGLAVEFSVDAFPAAPFTGTIKEIRYAPQTVQNVVTYDAVVSVENADLRLRPGMTTDVSFVLEERPEALLVPNAALRFRPPEGLKVDDSALREEASAAAGGSAASADTASGGAPGTSLSRTERLQRAAERRRARAAQGEGGGALPSQPLPSAADGASAPRAPRRVIWTLGPDGAPRAVPVRIGITDGRFTELVEAPLQEGAAVIVGGGDGAGASDPGAQGGRRGGPGGGGRRMFPF